MSTMIGLDSDDTWAVPVSESPRRAVVLGAGGVVGTAWMAGLAAGLRDRSVDFAEADLLVGTSAGAIVGAILATDQALGPLATPPSATVQGPPLPDSDRLGEVLAVLTDPNLDPVTARRRVGDLAVAAGMAEPDHLARVESLIAAREWPDRHLLITAVDTDTGQRHIWDRASGVPLVAAVASSMAFPAASPPITINGRRYMDGGLWSATNADLAAGARTLVVIQPLAHLFPSEPLRRELAVVAADTVVTITPNSAAVAAFGSDLYNRAAWQPSYQAGARQAAELAQPLHATWHDADGNGQTGGVSRITY